MSHHLTLEVPDELYEPMSSAASQAGQTMEEWAIARLRALTPTATERSAALARLLRHAGAVDLGRPTGADNAGIDADLSQETVETHEGGA